MTGEPHPGVDVAPAPTMQRATFDEFFAGAWPSAARLGALMTQSAAVGEDLAQEALARMFHDWDTIENPTAYLRRSLTNGAANWSRSQRTQRLKLPLVAGGDRVDPQTDYLADVIAGLPFRQRAVIVLRYYADLSESEIADALGCRPGTVKSLASRALDRLSQELQP